MEAENTRAAGWDNTVPQTPKWVNWILYAVGGLSVLLLALCAYVVSVYSGVWFDVMTPALSLMLFACVWTWLFLAAYFLVPRFFPHIYNKWSVVGIMSLTVFFWLVAWALLAARVSAESYLKDYGAYLSNLSFPTSNFDPNTSSIIKRSPSPKKTSSTSNSRIRNGSSYSYSNKFSTAWKIAAAAAGIGALVWVLMVVALVFYSLACHRSRTVDEEYETGEPKPMPPAAPVGEHEMGHYAPPATTGTPNPEQQFAHGMNNSYDQSAYNQNQPYQPPQHQVPI